jgi:D-psicose/D-tagatose/L-ribulose 3-epimerase
MRFGCCGSMISPATDPVGVEIVEKLAAFGFDYIELSLAHIAEMEEESFRHLADRVAKSGLRCEACNNFFPPRVRLTGPDASLPRAHEYAGRAIERAARLGAKIIVFGSSGAKNVPPGFPHDRAWRQIVELLRTIGPLAARHGVTIAIEPLNRQESNIVNLASEGLRLAREVDHPNVQLLVDFYHFRKEDEPFEVLGEAGSAIRHTHFAELQARAFPTEEQEGYGRFFECLHRIRYDGRCSIEAYTQDFVTDAPKALANLRRIAGRCDAGRQADQ